MELRNNDRPTPHAEVVLDETPSPVNADSRPGIPPGQEGAMKQLCNDLHQFAIQVRQLGYSLDGGVAERECLVLSERMLAAVKQAEARMAPGAKSVLRAHTRC